MDLEYCEECGEQLKESQIGLCDACQEAIEEEEEED